MLISIDCITFPNVINMRITIYSLRNTYLFTVLFSITAKPITRRVTKTPS